MSVEIEIQNENFSMESDNIIYVMGSHEIIHIPQHTTELN